MAPKWLTGWWTDRNTPDRIEIYTRYSFLFFALAELLWVGVSALRWADTPTAVRLGLFALVAAHAATSALASVRALDWAMERRGRPTAEFVVCWALACGLFAGSLALCATGQLSQRVIFATAVGPLIFAVVPVTANLANRHQPRVVVAVGLLVGLGSWVAGLPGRTPLAMGFAALWFALFAAFTARFSTWLVAVVWELYRARETQTRLAVAEERLRFSRDLHDVLGRNLSVIALKSELAVQLAQRGEAGQRSARDQMVEVQRLARDSQREVREVVRGYRETGLDTELAGARGVLESAGIDCEIATSGVDRLPHPVQTALGWVVREGTTNVLRHSEAANCAIRLRQDGERAVLVVANNGSPVNGTGRGDGSGLKGLRERLARLNGTLRTERGGDGTFRLTAEVPYGEDGGGEPKVVGT
ncbi:histidine kinase [Streptomyces sp. NPDC005438]|uniref:sensor histidine kinase n=1 Tax=Streptomyces sp. NPDC005438 TaxID=3156880 RepID=UPI0033A99A96